VKIDTWNRLNKLAKGNALQKISFGLLILVVPGGFIFALSYLVIALIYSNKRKQHKEEKDEDNKDDPQQS
jgi:hypothetical protein